MGRRVRGRFGISVMFMTFIAVSILSLVFMTYYFYLTRQNLSASEAERLYAEAAQERLEVILDRRAKEVIVNNVGGIGVTIKYLVGLDKSGGTAVIGDVAETIIPVGGSKTLRLDASLLSREIYVMTERGNLFRAVPGGFQFELEGQPPSISLGKGGAAVVTLKLKAALLETPEQGAILIVGDPDGCVMATTTTRTHMTGILYLTRSIIAGTTTYVAGGRTYVVGPITLTVVTSISAFYTTETVTRTNEWVRTPSPLSTNLNTRIKTTMTTSITISAQALDYWGDAGCFIWFKVLNATSGSKLAEAGVRVTATK